MKIEPTPLLLAALALGLSFPQVSQAVALSKAATDTVSAAETIAETPPSESPACVLEGTVRSAEENTTDSHYFDISIEFNSFSATQEKYISSCDTGYGSQIEKAGQIMKAADFENQALQVGDSVKANVKFESDGKRTGYFLSDIKIISKAEADGNTTAQESVDSAATQKKNDSFLTLISGFSVITIVVLAFVIIASQKRK